MVNIQIISASVRKSRKSHRVALYLKNFILNHKLADAEIIDLNAYQFPIFNERLKFQDNPDKEVLEFAEKIKRADGIIIVVPEYNGGYPAGIKNIIDLLYEEWRRKPVSLATVSDGDFGGSQVLFSLQFILWKVKALTVSAVFPVPNVDKSFDENGKAIDEPRMNKRAQIFIDELLWHIEAVRRMN